MPNYEITTSETPKDMSKVYNFPSTQKAKKYFCNKIFSLDYYGDHKDGFVISSKYFEEMGALLSKYTNEKCYAIKSFSQSIYDLARWGNYNKVMLQEEYFLKSINKKCNSLFNALTLKTNDHSKILMPWICCNEDKLNESFNRFTCSKDDITEKLEEFGCARLEGVCDLSGSEYNIFKSDEL